MRFANASPIFDVLLILLIHLSFLYYTGIAEQAFGKCVIFSFNPFVFSLAYKDVQAFRLLLLKNRNELCSIQALRPIVEKIFR